MMKNVLLPLLAALTIFAATIAAKPSDKAWLDAKVVSVGHVSNDNGQQTPTVTAVLYDPENSNPFARKIGLVITLQPFSGKSKVDLSVGTTLKAYRSGETSTIYGFLVIRFVDDKGHEKSELHPILQELDPSDAP